jgi:hypothetical protein
MRTKIRVGDKWYKPVPWFEHKECDGCAFESNSCINGGSAAEKFRGLCDANQEFEGMIFIPNNKEALAEYVAKRLDGNQEEDEP